MGVAPSRGPSTLLGIIALRLGHAVADATVAAVAALPPGSTSQELMTAAAGQVLSALDQLTPADQRSLLGSLACVRASGDAVLLAACGGLAPDGEQHRMLASSGGSASGSGSGSMDPDACPHKHGGHHATNREHIELMVVAVIMLTVVVEVLTHKLDHYAEHSGEHIFQIVQRVYKELMLLGIISFSLFFFEASFCLAPEITYAHQPPQTLPLQHIAPPTPSKTISYYFPSHSSTRLRNPLLSHSHELHIIHILIFFISIAYIAEAIFILYVAGAIARHWTRLEGISLMQYAALKMQVKERCRATCCARLHMQSHAARAS